MVKSLTRTWRPTWPCPVRTILRQQRRGLGDPTLRLDKAGRHWRACRTPIGPATLAIDDTRAGEVGVEAWGPGAEWVLDQMPALLGAEDDWTEFEPRHPVVAEALRRNAHLRLGRTDLPFESLVPSIIEQKVTGQEAFAGFRQLVRRHGDPAPGPGPDHGLWLQPAGEVIQQIPSWEWLRLHIDPARSRALVTAARRVRAIDQLVGADHGVAPLSSLPGVGRWTMAEVQQRALGDPDAVSFGDYHVAKNLGWALAGRAFDDRELHEFLEPWKPQRGRIQMLVLASGLGKPRRGPRMAPRNHLPSR